jgi:hypothetical protein
VAADATLSIVPAPATHTAPPSSLQRQSAGAPLWTIQQVAPAPARRLRRSGSLRAIARAL